MDTRRCTLRLPARDLSEDISKICATRAPQVASTWWNRTFECVDRHLTHMIPNHPN